MYVYMYVFLKCRNFMKNSCMFLPCFVYRNTQYKLKLLHQVLVFFIKDVGNHSATEKELFKEITENLILP